MAGPLHEKRSDLPAKVLDLHRAIQSLIEELDAVDWYEQRRSAAQDKGLRDILAHNRDEEKEHAAMLLEWLRRNDPGFSNQLKDYLFTEDPITEVEEEEA
jgi:ferritin-like protein